jgi:hypothetical protein
MLLSSPLFEISPTSHQLWRNSVHEVWAYIQTNHLHGINHFNNTSIQISMEPNFLLEDVRRIAQCGIHFEPAIEAFLPETPDAGENYASNWVLSWDLAPSGRTRPDSIEFIENSLNSATVSNRMQNNTPLGNFTWEFKHLGQPQERIEFHRCPAVHNAQQSIQYLEFTVRFVGAAMQCSRQQLLMIPSNVGGLQWFLANFTGAWLDNNALMPVIWEGVALDAMSEPRICEWTEAQQEHIEVNHLRDVTEMMGEDLERCRLFANNAQAPYF